MEETPELVQVLQELGPGFTRWYPLGLFLRVPFEELNAIKATEHDILNQTIQMLERWYAHKSPTWEALCQALRNVGHRNLADRISVQYLPRQEIEQLTSSSVCEPSKAEQQLVTCYRPPSPIPSHGPHESRTEPTLREKQQQATASQQTLPIPEDKRICDLDEEEKYDISLEFAAMFVTVVQVLNTILPVDTLKIFLDSFHHSMTGQPYVNSQLYKKCKTTEEILKSLHPRYINPMNMFLLREIVQRFGNDEVKQRVEMYDRNFPYSVPIRRLGNPLTDEEMDVAT